MTSKEIEDLIIKDIKRFGGKIPKGTKFYWSKLIEEFAHQEVINSRQTKSSRKINAKEKAKGRSENYYQLSEQEQWNEDERLGILDWDGK